MADDGSFESGVARWRIARSTLPALLLPRARSSVERTLEAWDGDIRRAAAAAAARSTDYRIDGDDLAQTARIQLWRALCREPGLPDSYIRRIVVNALRSSARAARAGLLFEAPERADHVAVDELVGTADPDRALAVRWWIASLSDRQRLLYELIYVAGHTQREAAQRLSVSQPRVAQLHQQLLERGRVHLQHHAA